MDRKYATLVDDKIDYCIYSMEEWNKYLKGNVCTPSTGYGYYIKDGVISDSEVFNAPILDSTHVVWYNTYN